MSGWALHALPGATLLMLIVLTLRVPVARLFGAQWAYALWLLPLLRLVVPVSLFRSPGPTILLILPSAGTAAPSAGAAYASIAAAHIPAATGLWPDLLVLLWLGGAIVFLLWQQAAYSSFLLRLGTLDEAARMACHGGIPVFRSGAVDGPVAIGLFRRRIVVPLDFALCYSAAEQQLALDHELVHHRRFDIAWNLAALLVLALNWFNPVAHLAFRAFRADQELACDAAVTRRMPAGRADYARALVKAACQGHPVPVAPLNHVAFLKRRLKMMNKHRGGSARALGGLGACCLAGVTGFALSSPGTASTGAVPAHHVLVATADGAAAAPVSDSDLARLSSACGHTDDTNQMIVCDERQARDPQVRAIADRIAAQARREAQAAVLRPERLAQIREAADRARAAADFARQNGEQAKDAALAARAAMEANMPDAKEQREIARRAIETARAQLAAIDVEKIQESVRAAIATIDSKDMRDRLTPAQLDDVHRALREVQSRDFRADLQRAQEDMQRELDKLNHD